MSEAALLRVLADRIDELDGLKEFPAETADPGSVTVQWTEGSDHPGYAALSKAISAVVEQHWAALRGQVLRQKETEVQDARRSWRDYTAEAGDEPAAGEPEMPVQGLSVPQQLSRVQQLVRQG